MLTVVEGERDSAISFSSHRFNRLASAIVFARSESSKGRAARTPRSPGPGLTPPLQPPPGNRRLHPRPQWAVRPRQRSALIQRCVGPAARAPRSVGRYARPHVLGFTGLSVPRESTVFESSKLGALSSCWRPAELQRLRLHVPHQPSPWFRPREDCHSLTE